MMSIEKVGILGCGLMGSGIAQVCASAGYETTVYEVSPDLYETGRRTIEKSLKKFLDRGKITPEEQSGIMARLKGSSALEELEDSDLIIEAIVENLGEKRKVFAELDSICKPTTIFASNTSSLSITEMMTATRRSARFVGLHFFNPVPIMALVEVVKTILTDEGAYGEVIEFARSLKKHPIRCADRPGFIVNRLLVPFLLDAIRALEEGVGSAEDIDQGMKLGCGHPMGPLTLLDFVGLDTTYYIANIMFDAYKEKRFAPPPLLKQMVLAGRLGRKSGHGFYNYS